MLKLNRDYQSVYVNVNFKIMEICIVLARTESEMKRATENSLLQF
jgi:hypothetical protein